MRKRFSFSGTIQGVGFRPAVYRCAASLGLTGFVQNRRSHVVAEVQGEAGALARFTARLRAELPPAAKLEGVAEETIPPLVEEPAFRIVESSLDRFAFPPIPPDLPLCPQCAAELLDPSNSRYLYPFITCTQCGPRYSIVERTPFDRENTSMRPFTQCPRCRGEYQDPDDRRFHSQTNSCPACGPRLACTDAQGRPLPGDPLHAAIGTLLRGGVLAVLGIGGFHLAADPRSREAMQRLRREKERERKPFALMAADLEEARALCTLTAVEEALLSSSEAPIVIAPRNHDAPDWLREVSDTHTLGVMLPYTPLHLLLFRHPELAIDYRHLVMTSGNRAQEPIITDAAEARESLGGVADAFLFHDRKIIFRTDDSIVRSGPSSAPFLLRRSRGWVPRLIRLARPVSGVVLGVGGDLKSAPALALGTDLHLSPFNGDLDDSRTQAQFERAIEQLLTLYEVQPDLAVHDLHPLYRSTQWAQGAGHRHAAIQHHYAHALSVMAEHGLDEALALTFDGTGYGTDGETWGGEFLHTTRSSFTRLGSIASFPLPGGDAAVLHPPRIAFALLRDPRNPIATRPVPLAGVDLRRTAILSAMLEKRVSCPATTSLGRVFDAAAAVLGLVETTSYEGEGPIRLEGEGLRAFSPGAKGAALMTEKEAARLLPLHDSPGDSRLFTIDPRPLLMRLAEGTAAESVPTLSLLFHEAVAMASCEGARRMRKATGESRVVLSGGVFQNLLLRELLVPLLIKDGFRVFLNWQAPPGDGGLAVGQAWYQER
ncbi:MAG: carbamoyltransferase HypF [Spirochaetia bacterium]